MRQRYPVTINPVWSTLKSETGFPILSTDKKYYSHERPELVELIAEHAPCVLDVGCGAGAMSAAIKRDRRVAEIWGIEVVESVAAEARNNPAIDHVLCGDIAQLLPELPDGQFSHIVAGDVLEHLIDPWSVLGVLRSKLRPDGLFICSIPNIRNFSFILKLLFAGRFEYRDYGVMDRTHLRFFARRDVRQLFVDAGFQQVQIGPVRPKKSLAKRAVRALFGDFIIKGFLVTAQLPGAGQPAK